MSLTGIETKNLTTIANHAVIVGSRVDILLAQTKAIESISSLIVSIQVYSDASGIDETGASKNGRKLAFLHNTCADINAARRSLETLGYECALVRVDDVLEGELDLCTLDNSKVQMIECVKNYFNVV